MESSGLCLIIVIFVFALFVIWLWNKSRREKYGGPIKNIRRIPKNTCYNMCNQNYNECMGRYAYVDADYCSRWWTSCRATCQYTNYHRL